MRSLWLGILLATVESLAFGQLDSDTLTVSVSQSSNLQPDQLVFGIRVLTPANRGLDEVVAGLKNAAVNFSSVTSSPDNATLAWVFTLAVPLSKVAATAKQLTTQELEFFVQGSQVSPASQQAQLCPIPSMMAEAKAQAKNLADAAELVVGDVLALSSGNASIPNSLILVPTAAARLYTSFLPIQWFAPLNAIQPVARAACSLTVKFKLLRYHY
jgi:uncharacterized protein YggE